MISNFTDLPEEDLSLFLDALPLITVYIAGVDGKIKEGELNWAEKLIKIRQFDFPSALNTYYEMVDDRISDRIDELRKELPGDHEKRREIIEERLSKLNPILGELETHTANNFVASFRSFAKHVARASGGIFGFGSISEKEARIMKLEMFTPIKGQL
ncbi:MAG: hypothetical protein HKN16_04110 [Saprospiraceae bacterium]|nr:hypothetical protein [Saprospiraceae bacterium]